LIIFVFIFFCLATILVTFVQGGVYSYPLLLNLILLLRTLTTTILFRKNIGLWTQLTLKGFLHVRWICQMDRAQSLHSLNCSKE
jgi:hypothetical protein